MDWGVDSDRLLWCDESWRITALLLVPTILVSLMFNSPVDVLVGGAALVGLVVILTRRVTVLRRGELQGLALDRLILSGVPYRLARGAGCGM